MTNLNLGPELDRRLESIELNVGRLQTLLVSTLGLTAILPDIAVAGSFPRGRSDVITKEGRANCQIRVTVDVSYTFHALRETKDPESGRVIDTCTTYKIDIKATAEEICSPADQARETRTTSHTLFKEYCSDDKPDDVLTGETLGFDGKKTETLTYGHGTKVKVEKMGEGVTITVAYPDGTQATTSF